MNGEWLRAAGGGGGGGKKERKRVNAATAYTENHGFTHILYA